MLSKIEKTFLPTEEEVRAYEKTGYHITAKISPDEFFKWPTRPEWHFSEVGVMRVVLKLLGQSILYPQIRLY